MQAGLERQVKSRQVNGDRLNNPIPYKTCFYSTNLLYRMCYAGVVITVWITLILLTKCVYFKVGVHQADFSVPRLTLILIPELWQLGHFQALIRCQKF